jgi:hypothetical protein
MKNRTLLISLTVMLLAACTSKPNPQYLFLTVDQLGPLGFTVTTEGIFYKNHIPNWQDAGERFANLGFYSTGDVYLNTIHFHDTDTLKPSTRYDSTFLALPATRFDFYPILVGNTRGEYSLKKTTNGNGLFPVAISMAELGIPGRTDTLVVWFKPTESLKNALPEGVKLEDYLRVPPMAQ